MNSKQLGNLALSRAISYFAGLGYYLFLPVADNGGAIDLVVSEDGILLLRVQCKGTHSIHTRYTENHPVYQVFLGQKRARGAANVAYTANAFDLLFVVAPDHDYLIPWAEFYAEGRRMTGLLLLGQKMARFRLPTPRT